MAVYSYARTSEVEALEARDQMHANLEKENLRVQTYALGMGYRVDEYLLDAGLLWSADFKDREKGVSLLNRLEPGDIVLTCSLERMFSSCEDMQSTVKAFRKMEVKLIVIDLEGELTRPDFHPPFEKVLKVFHRLEKRRSTERIKTVKQNQRQKGRFLGGSRPFGYMIHSNGRLIENPMEQKVLKQIIKMKEQGKSLRAISSEVSTPMMPVSFKTVQRLLKRHAGEVTQKPAQQDNSEFLQL